MFCTCRDDPIINSIMQHFCTCRDDPIINFNYTIFLYNADDKAGARRQFRLYETKSRKWTISDQEVNRVLCNGSEKWEPLIRLSPTPISLSLVLS